MTGLQETVVTTIQMGPTIMSPASQLEDFLKWFQKNGHCQRMGQAFFNYANLSKVTSEQNKTWLDKLYNIDDSDFISMISGQVQWEM